MVSAERFKVFPAHTGLLEEATGVAGVGLITTLAVDGALLQPFTVAITLYVPASAEVTFALVGFCWLVKLFGPVQL